MAHVEDRKVPDKDGLLMDETCVLNSMVIRTRTMKNDTLTITDEVTKTSVSVPISQGCSILSREGRGAIKIAEHLLIRKINEQANSRKEFRRQSPRLAR